MHPSVFVITGAMASGKSTVARALAGRFERSAHVEGDAFFRMIINGKANMGPVLDAEALAQLQLRHRLASDAVRGLAQAGFTVVYEDILIGQHLLAAVERLVDLKPQVVVLTPSVETLSSRDSARDKTGYSEDFPPHVLADALVNETPRIGTWLDTSDMTVEDVVAAILESPPTQRN